MSINIITERRFFRYLILGGSAAPATRAEKGNYIKRIDERREKGEKERKKEMEGGRKRERRIKHEIPCYCVRWLYCPSPSLSLSLFTVRPLSLSLLSLHYLPVAYKALSPSMPLILPAYSHSPYTITSQNTIGHSDAPIGRIRSAAPPMTRWHRRPSNVLQLPRVTMIPGPAGEIEWMCR